MSRSVARAIGVPLVACSILAASTAAASTGPTGSPQAIVLFRAAAHATNSLPAYVITQSGYVRIFDSLGPRRRVHWAWGWDQFQPGYRPATERLVLVQHAGRTDWIEDTLTPTAKSCRGGCAVVPIELLITPTAAYDGLISSESDASAACFERIATTRVPYPAGGAWWTAVGALSAPVRAGRLTEITSRFGLGQRQIRESDWLRTATRLFARSVVRVAAGSGTAAFSYSSSDARLPSTPAFPTITLCS